MPPPSLASSLQDNKVNQMVVTRMLHNLGLKYDVVDNGRLAMQACACRDYDLVLMVGVGRACACVCACVSVCVRARARVCV